MIVYDNIYLQSHCLEDFRNLYDVDVRVIEIIRFSSITHSSSWLLQRANEKEESKFCIEFDVEITDENIEWLIRFSFLPGYVKTNDTIRCFAGTAESSPLRQALHAQGYSTAEVVTPSEAVNMSIGPVRGYMYQSKNSLIPDLVITQMVEASPQTVSLARQYIFPVSGLENTIKRVIRENEQLASDLHLSATELENYKKYLAIALREKETEKIITFYHQEYEVLPLWYKRFGHLIKIMTGHRRLKPKQ